MSRIGERIQRLHKPVASLGFGFVPTSAPRRQMLLVVRYDGRSGEQDMSAALGSADAVVVMPGAPDCDALRQGANVQPGSMPLGVWVEQAPVLPVEATESCYDFLVCDFNGPGEAVSRKNRGLLIRVESDVEASRLRAVGELGVDAVVLDAKTLDLSRLSSVVECRRLRSASGKPVILHIDRLPQAGQLVVLWQAGVDGLLVDSTVGADVLAAIRTTINSAVFEPRPGSGGPDAAIGAYVGALSQPEADEEGGGDGDDDDDDDA